MAEGVGETKILPTEQWGVEVSVYPIPENWGVACQQSQLVYKPTARDLPKRAVCATRFIRSGFSGNYYASACDLDDCPVLQASMMQEGFQKTLLEDTNKRAPARVASIAAKSRTP